MPLAVMEFIAQAGLNRTVCTVRMLRAREARLQRHEPTNSENQDKRPFFDSPMLCLIYATILLLMVSPFLVTLVIVFGPTFLIVCAAVSVIGGVVMVTLSICFVCFLTCLLCFNIFVITVKACWQAVKNVVMKVACQILYIVFTPSRLWERFKTWIEDIRTQPFRNVDY